MKEEKKLMHNPNSIIFFGMSISDIREKVLTFFDGAKHPTQSDKRIQPRA